MGFPNQVNTVAGIAFEGDFASSNPRASVLGGYGQFIAGAAGVYVGRFAWLSPSEDGTVSNSGAGMPSGFIHREGQAAIVDYLAEGSMLIPAGWGVTIMSAGDFYVKNNGSTYAKRGDTAYVNFADGKVTFGAAGSAASSTLTAALTAGTSSVTGSIVNNVLTVTAVGSGALNAATTISGTGVVSGTRIARQLTGTAGGIGTYEVNIGGQSVASTTISGTYGILTVSAASPASLSIGDLITGSGVTATNIRQLGTGIGGTGTYFVDVSQAVSSQAMAAGLQYESKWRAQSQGAAGELVAISSWPLG